ncbi:MAG: sialate O-acetylesterase [Planctomycetaceae bacterium]
MMPLVRFAFVLFAISVLSMQSWADDDFAIRDGDTVAFMGDSITAARTYGKHIENYTLLRYPDRKVRFINVGIGGDTAAGGLARLERDVFKNHVTLLTVAFGVNDIGWGFYADDSHRQTYLDSIRGIVKACQEQGVRVYICSAAITGENPDKAESGFLQQMCDAGLAIAKEEGGETIDVQRTMREVQRRVLDSNKGKPADQQESLHVKDGVHLSDLGQLAMAYAILKGLGAPENVSTAAVDAKSSAAGECHGCTVSDVVKSEDSKTLSFNRLDEGLPFNNGLFSALQYRFVPMHELNRYRLHVANLEPGKYALTVDGRSVGVWNAQQLASGVDLASATTDAWQPGGPWDAQATSLKSLTDARHDIALSEHLAGAYLPESKALPTFRQQSAYANDRLEEMQRLVARPRPYKFVLALEEVKTTIASPLEYQVFQRHAKNAGKVTVRGTTTSGADKAQVQFHGKPLEGSLLDGWQSINIDKKNGTFSQTLELPAGGWFSMDLQLMRDGKVVHEQTVSKFGVGEVFVGAGQSNSTNSGEFKTQQTSGMVSSFSGEAWQIADDPQPGVADKSQGGSYYPAFGDALYAKYKVPIGIAATGYGGTSVNAWDPDKGLFGHMLTRIGQLGEHGFRAVLWHQGEADVGMPSDEYYDKLKRVIETSQQKAGWKFPWGVAQVSYHNPDHPKYDTTRTAQARLWADGVAFEGPDTDTLTGDDRDIGGKGIHFSPKGLKAHGELWAEKVSLVIDAAIGK